MLYMTFCPTVTSAIHKIAGRNAEQGFGTSLPPAQQLRPSTNNIYVHMLAQQTSNMSPLYVLPHWKSFGLISDIY